MIPAGPSDLQNNFKHSLPRPHGRGYYMTALRAYSRESQNGKPDPVLRRVKIKGPDVVVRLIKVSLKRYVLGEATVDQFARGSPGFAV